MHACLDAGIGRTTVYKRRDEEPAFAANLASAIEEATDLLEREAIRRGSEGYNEPVIHQGRLMGVWFNPDGTPAPDGAPSPAVFLPLTVRKYSDALLALLLKSRRYGDTVKHQHAGDDGGPIRFIEVPCVQPTRPQSNDPPTIIDVPAAGGEDS